jgi:hypothetical protein
MEQMTSFGAANSVERQLTGIRLQIGGKKCYRRFLQTGKKQVPSSFTSKAMWNIWACAQEAWDDCGYDNQLGKLCKRIRTCVSKSILVIK